MIGNLHPQGVFFHILLLFVYGVFYVEVTKDIQKIYFCGHWNHDFFILVLLELRQFSPIAMS